MATELYSVEQVAELLGLHVRTVRNYVRDGRLKAVRIGKQYRIARADLEALTGQPAAAPEQAGPPRRVEVSTIVDIDGIDRTLVERVTSLLMGATATNRDDPQPLRMQTVHDAERARLKIIVVGGVAATVELLRLVDAMVEGES